MYNIPANHPDEKESLIDLVITYNITPKTIFTRIDIIFI